MSIIKCPECEQNISNKSKKCIHCGKLLTEKIPKKNLCGECGFEIPLNSIECLYCGYPIEKDMTKKNVFAEFIKENKKVLIVIAIIVAVSILATFIIINSIGMLHNTVGILLNDEEESAYQCASKLLSMTKSTDSFQLCDEMFLLKHYTESGINDYTYTIFKFIITDTNGKAKKDTAVFKDGKYIMSYSNIYTSINGSYIEKEKLSIVEDITLYEFDGNIKNWERVNIDFKKIEQKLKQK